MTPTEIIHTSAKLREGRITMLRMESFGPLDYAKNAVLSFKESAFSLKNYLVFLQGFKGTDKTVSALRVAVEKAGTLDNFNYVSNDDLWVPCPTGFKGPYLPYLMELNENFTPILQEVVKEINKFGIELSQFISNKEVKYSLRDNGNETAKLRKWRETKTALTGSYFSKGDNQRIQLGKVFGNKDEIIQAGNVAYAAYQKAYTTDPRDIKGAVDVLNSKLEVVIELAEGEEEIEISKEALLNLSEKAYEVGRLIELLAVHSIQCETAGVLMTDVLDRVTKLVK